MTKTKNNNTPSLWTNPISPNVLALALPRLEKLTYIVLKIFCPHNSGVFRITPNILAGYISEMQLDEDLAPKASEVRQALANLHIAGLLVSAGGNVVWFKERWSETNNPNNKIHASNALVYVGNFPEVAADFCIYYKIPQEWATLYLPDNIEVPEINDNQMEIEDALELVTPGQAVSNPIKKKKKIKKNSDFPKGKSSSTDDELLAKKPGPKKNTAANRATASTAEALRKEHAELVSAILPSCAVGLKQFETGYFSLFGPRKKTNRDWRNYIDKLEKILFAAKDGDCSMEALNHGLKAAGSKPSSALKYVFTSAIKFDLEAKAKLKREEPETPDAATLAALRGNNDG